MPAVRKIESRYDPNQAFHPDEVYLVTLTQDDLAIVVESTLHWNVEKEKALEIIINGGMKILREVLTHPNHPRPPEIH